MNKHDDILREAIGRRGADLSLPPDFTLGFMARVRKEERRRRRIGVIWSIFGIVASLVAVVVVCMMYCREAFSDVMLPFRDLSGWDSPFMGMALPVIVGVGILLVVDTLVRVRVADKAAKRH